MADKIRFRSVADAAGYTKVPDKLLFDKRVSDTAFRTHMVQQMLLGQLGTMPTHEQLAATRRVSVPTVYRHLAELRRWGYVETEAP